MNRVLPYSNRPLQSQQWIHVRFGEHAFQPHQRELLSQKASSNQSPSVILFTKLNILDLTDWANIKMPKITQKIVEKAYDYIKSTDRFVSVNAQLESIQQEINDLNKNRKNLTENEYDEKRGSLNQTKNNLNNRELTLNACTKPKSRTDGGGHCCREGFSIGQTDSHIAQESYSNKDGEGENGRQSIRLQQRMFEVLSRCHKSSTPEVIKGLQPRSRFPFPVFGGIIEIVPSLHQPLDYWTVYTPPQKEIKDEMKNFDGTTPRNKQRKLRLPKEEPRRW